MKSEQGFSCCGQSNAAPLGVSGRHRKSSVAILAALVVWGPTSLTAQEAAGYVLTVKGSWMAMPGSVQLAPGRPVAAGNRIQPANAVSSITVAFLDGSAKTFTAAFTVDSQHSAEGSGASRMLAAVAKTMKQEKRPAIFGISRGSTEIHPAVLKLTGKRLDLAPAMGSLASGQYLLELFPANGGEAVEAKCDFDPPSATSATVRVLAGLYTLRVNSSSGTPLGSAIVLVASPQDFDGKTGAFRKGVEMTGAWPRDTDPAAIQQFLTALLIDLLGTPAQVTP